MCSDTGISNPLVVSPASFAGFPGAAFTIAADGAVEILSDMGGYGAAVLRDEASRLDLLERARTAISAATASRQLLTLAAQGMALDVTIMPTGGGTVLALLRTTEFEQSLRTQLIESRERYRGFLALGGDFAWETDAGGRFAFVSPNARLGWTPDDLIGRPAATLYQDREESTSSPGASVFSTRTKVEEAELWLRRADGDGECVLVSAVPLVDRAGEWRGARGICRIVTEARRREANQARTRLRDRVTLHLARLVRSETDLAALLRSTASMLGVAIGGSGGAIFRWTDEAWREEANWGDPAPPDGLAERIRRMARAAATERVEDGVRTLLVETHIGNMVNGVLAAVRPDTEAGFGEEERVILAEAAAQLAPIFAQMNQNEHTNRLARTDPLTGLLNRRALLEEGTRRLRRVERTGRPVAVLYIDLDNFKLVNDRRGHQKGDEAIVALSDLLRENSRSEDLVARLGGDEFVLWLDGVDRTMAEKRARQLLHAARILAPFTLDPARPLGISIGVALHTLDEDETAQGIIARADAALYAAKQAGKGRFALARPAAALAVP